MLLTWAWALRRIAERWKAQASRLRRETYALYLALKDRRTPWYARLMAALVVGYALSPIDLIPDFVPVLGYLDDLVIVPLGIAVTIRLLPEAVMADARAGADQLLAGEGRPVSRSAAVVVIVIWILLAAFLLTLAVRRFAR